MLQVVVTLQNRSLSLYAQKLRDLSDRGRVALAEGLNQGGYEVRALTVAAETAQTGLKEGTIQRAQKTIDASPNSLSFTIHSRGGEVRLKYFGATETPAGVMAHPFNRSTVYQHSFMKGGRFPNRVTITKLNGQVFERTGTKRKPLRIVRSGVVIPTEMTKGSTANEFRRGVEGVLAPTIIARLGALLP